MGFQIHFLVLRSSLRLVVRVTGLDEVASIAFAAVPRETGGMVNAILEKGTAAACTGNEAATVLDLLMSLGALSEPGVALVVFESASRALLGLSFTDFDTEMTSSAAALLVLGRPVFFLSGNLFAGLGTIMERDS